MHFMFHEIIHYVRKRNNLEILAAKFYLGVFLIPSFKLSKSFPSMLEAKR